MLSRRITFYFLVLSLAVAMSLSAMPSVFAGYGQTTQPLLASEPPASYGVLGTYIGDTVRFTTEFPTGQTFWSNNFDRNILDCHADHISGSGEVRDAMSCTVKASGSTAVSTTLSDGRGGLPVSNIIKLIAKARPTPAPSPVPVTPTVTLTSSPAATNGEVVVPVGAEVVFSVNIQPAGNYGWNWAYDRTVLECRGVPDFDSNDNYRCRAKRQGTTTVVHFLNNTANHSYSSNAVVVEVVAEDDLVPDDSQDEEVRAAFDPKSLVAQPQLFRKRSDPSMNVIKLTAHFNYYGDSGYSFQDVPLPVVGWISCHLGGSTYSSTGMKLLYSGSMPLQQGQNFSIPFQFTFPKTYKNLLKREGNFCEIRSSMGGYKQLRYNLKQVGRNIQLTQAAQGSFLEISNEYVHPNPFNANRETAAVSFTLNRAANVSVYVSHRNGTLIKELSNRQPPPQGSSSVRWDGKDQNGSAVPEGIYTFSIGADATNGSLENDSFTGYFALNRN